MINSAKQMEVFDFVGCTKLPRGPQGWKALLGWSIHCNPHKLHTISLLWSATFSFFPSTCVDRYG